MSTPSISIIMPIKNMARFLHQAVESVAAQQHPITELLIVDDQSEDNLHEVVDQLTELYPWIRILEGPGMGPGIARNLALEQAKGELITFLDADDLWPQDKLQRQLTRLEKEPRVDVVSGMVRIFSLEDPTKSFCSDSFTWEDTHIVQIGALILRRSVLDIIGGFNPEFLYAEDIDFLLRLREAQIPTAVLPVPTLFYRRHSSSLTTHTTEREKNDFKQSVLRSIIRRKAKGRLHEPISIYKHHLECE